MAQLKMSLLNTKRIKLRKFAVTAALEMRCILFPPEKQSGCVHFTPSVGLSGKSPFKPGDKLR